MLHSQASADRTRQVVHIVVVAAAAEVTVETVVEVESAHTRDRDHRKELAQEHQLDTQLPHHSLDLEDIHRVPALLESSLLPERNHTVE